MSQGANVSLYFRPNYHLNCSRQLSIRGCQGTISARSPAGIHWPRFTEKSFSQDSLLLRSRMMQRHSRGRLDSDETPCLSLFPSRVTSSRQVSCIPAVFRSIDSPLLFSSAPNINIINHTTPDPAREDLASVLATLFVAKMKRLRAMCGIFLPRKVIVWSIYIGVWHARKMLGAVYRSENRCHQS